MEAAAATDSFPQLLELQVRVVKFAGELTPDPVQVFAGGGYHNGGKPCRPRRFPRGRLVLIGKVGRHLDALCACQRLHLQHTPWATLWGCEQLMSRPSRGLAPVSL